MPPGLRPLHGRLAGREAGWATVSGVPESWCFGGSVPPRLLTLGCGGAPGSTPGVVSCFPMKHSSDGKVADSSARETGGKLSNKGSLHSTKQTPTGSNGIRAGPRRGRRAGPTGGGVPPLPLPESCSCAVPCVPLASMGKRENGYWEPTGRGPAGPAPRL